MKLKSAWLILLLMGALQVNAQSKKDMDQKILLLEEKVKNLENEISNLKTTLSNTSTTMSLVSKSNTDLEKTVAEQTALIKKLIHQNDSLLLSFQGKKDADFVMNPRNEEDSIIYMIQQYYACKKWEDRVAFVLKPDVVKPLMKAYYNDDYKSASVKREDINVQGGGFKLNEGFKVRTKSGILYCKKTPEGFRIDWEASAGYNAKSFEDFLSEKLTTPTTFRLKIELSDNYDDDYNITEKDYFSFRGWSINGRSNGFKMKKSSPGAGELKKIVSDGKAHEVIVELQFKTLQHKKYPGGEIPSTFIFVTKFIKEGWSKD